MSDRSNIAWTNATWNPARGCERVSEGCRNCYAEVLAARHSYEGGWGSEVAQWVTRLNGEREARWTGVIEVPNHAMKAPLKWREPRRVFVNSMSDLFHERVPFNVVDNIFDVMARCPQHTFQILTKRPGRMLEYSRLRQSRGQLVLPNVWQGVSAEDQATFDERVELLGMVRTAVRFVSAEPLLGWIDVGNAFDDAEEDSPYQPVDWLIVGGESGQGFRPMDMEAARWLIEQCRLSDVPCFLKQDNGARPGMQGRFSADEWAIKQYPRGHIDAEAA